MTYHIKRERSQQHNCIQSNKNDKINVRDNKKKKLLEKCPTKSQKPKIRIHDELKKGKYNKNERGCEEEI